MASKKGFYITTAIAYPNARIHVGFGWEAAGADMVARFHRMLGKSVFFCTGLDEHSQNVEKAATKAGLAPQAYCDQMAVDIKKVIDQMDIAYDRFIRTTDPDHQKVCEYLIQKAYESQDVYKQKYEGWYCNHCEVFYTEKEVGDSLECPVHKSQLSKSSEENYFFKLSRYEEKLKKLFSDKKRFLEPESRRNEISTFIDQGLRDFSVSRTSLKWGIPLPFDKTHVIYVWYDALINYLSAVKFNTDPDFFKKFWPCDVHVIGKEITRFHCVYWPAMLWSAGIELPEHVWAHGHIYFQGEKMSKTRGNIVTPDDVMKDFGTTALRWYLLSAVHFDSDGNYSDQDLVLKCNADLSNNIGNLVNRVVSMTQKYFGENSKDALSPENIAKLPSGVESVKSRLKHHLGAHGERLSELIDAMDLSQYCTKVLDFSMSLNKFIDETKPWNLAKKEEERPVLATALAELLEGIRHIAIALWPIVPQASEAIFSQLGLNSDEDWLKNKLYTDRTISVPRFDRFGFDAKRRFSLSAPKPIFPRLEMKE